MNVEIKNSVWKNTALIILLTALMAPVGAALALGHTDWINSDRTDFVTGWIINDPLRTRMAGMIILALWVGFSVGISKVILNRTPQLWIDSGRLVFLQNEAEISVALGMIDAVKPVHNRNTARVDLTFISDLAPSGLREPAKELSIYTSHLTTTPKQLAAIIEQAKRSDQGKK